MFKEHGKHIVMGGLLLSIPIIVGLLFYPQLPSEMPIHFNFSGEVDQYTHPLFVIVGLPILLYLLTLFIIWLMRSDPKKENIHPKMQMVSIYLLPVIGNVICLYLISYALGLKLNAFLVVDLLLGVLFLILGNYVTKGSQNFTVGLRTRWTMHSRLNWNMSNRLAGRCMVLSGIIFIISAIFNQLILPLIFVLISSVIVPIIYSYLLYRKGI